MSSKSNTNMSITTEKYWNDIIIYNTKNSLTRRKATDVEDRMYEGDNDNQTEVAKQLQLVSNKADCPNRVEPFDESRMSISRMNRYMEVPLIDVPRSDDKDHEFKEKKSRKTSKLGLTSEGRAALRKTIKKKLKKIAEDRMTIRQIFSRFARESTLHGFAYVFSKSYIIRRSLWAVLMILGSIYFVVKLQEGIREYLQYPFATSTTIDYVNSLQFPAISICPVNNLKLIKYPKDHTFNRLLQMKRFPLHRNWSTPHLDIRGDDLKTFIDNTSVVIEDILKECEWIAADTFHLGQNPCSASNFTPYYNVDGKLCFTVNSGQDGFKLLQINRSGLNFGYTFLFDIHIANLLHIKNYSGLEVIVHNQSVVPTQEQGFIVTPGFHTYVNIDPTVTHNLPPPFSTNCGKKDLKYFKEYNQKSCFLEKLTDFIGDRCECRELYMPDNGLKLCSLKQAILCTLPYKEAFSKYELLQSCPTDCEITSYHIDLSYAQYMHVPPKGIDERLEMVKAQRNSANTTYILSLSQRMTTKDLDNYIRNNLISIIFYFDAMEKYIITQEPSFDFYQFLGNMGGEIGLMLGASLLTFAEFIDLFLHITYHQLLRFHSAKRKRTLEATKS